MVVEEYLDVTLHSLEEFAVAVQGWEVVRGNVWCDVICLPFDPLKPLYVQSFHLISFFLPRLHEAFLISPDLALRPRLPWTPAGVNNSSKLPMPLLAAITRLPGKNISTSPGF